MMRAPVANAACRQRRDTRIRQRALRAVLTLAAIAAGLGLPHTGAAEIRCGWLENPTPGNWWLTDRHGSWTLSVMGGPEAEGMDRLPDIAGDQYVQTNGHHGYGCACLTVVSHKRTQRIVKVLKARQLPLSACRRDERLNEPSRE
ncbi:DUF4087 domain-containing protein [Burkholderia singularis]|uniref:Putative exported protein n=1 Tax=Burkholderia singularis TaxID=1503053 RepID=A0A238HCA3_9BURK|nr:Putative exported protein precursor [Burkholderia singularis]